LHGHGERRHLSGRDVVAPALDDGGGAVLLEDDRGVGGVLAVLLTVGGGHGHHESIHVAHFLFLLLVPVALVPMVSSPSLAFLEGVLGALRRRSACRLGGPTRQEFDVASQVVHAKASPRAPLESDRRSLDGSSHPPAELSGRMAGRGRPRGARAQGIGDGARPAKAQRDFPSRCLSPRSKRVTVIVAQATRAAPVRSRPAWLAWSALAGSVWTQATRWAQATSRGSRGAGAALASTCSSVAPAGRRSATVITDSARRRTLAAGSRTARCRASPRETSRRARRTVRQTRAT